MLITCRTVVFDTGSPDLIIPSGFCTPAENCVAPGHFNRNTSSTFSMQSSVQPFEMRFFGTGAINFEPDVYGFVGNDTVCVGGYCVEQQGFGIVVYQTAAFRFNPYSGMFGLSFASQGVTTAIPFLMNLVNGGEVSPLFGFYLSPWAIGNAELTLGDIDESKVKSDIHYLEIDQYVLSCSLFIGLS